MDTRSEIFAWTYLPWSKLPTFVTTRVVREMKWNKFITPWHEKYYIIENTGIIIQSTYH